MAHKITGRNMFFLYTYIIHVLFALLLKHGGNGKLRSLILKLGFSLLFLL